MGGDGLAPFFEKAEHGVFILAKTSNAGADEFQALETAGGTLFEIVAQQAQAWNTRNNVGIVVGATDPARLARVRERVPAMWFLVPGIPTKDVPLGKGVTADLDAANPMKPIRLLDGFPAGGGTDYLARVIGRKLADRFGQSIIVDNRPGAASNLAASAVGSTGAAVLHDR